MSHKVGIWIDHKKAVIVSASADRVTTKTLESEVGAHPRYSGQQDGGGEKKYEQRHGQHLDRYYDEVISQLGQPEALLIFGPGEAKLQLKERLSRSKALSERIVGIETTDKLTDPQIVAKVKSTSESFEDCCRFRLATVHGSAGSLHYHPIMTRASSDVFRTGGRRGRRRGRHAHLRAVAAGVERGDRLNDIPADRSRGRRHLPPVGRGGDVGRRDALLQLLFPAAGRHLDDCRPAELGRAVRVSGRQPGRQQPVGGGPRAHAGSGGAPGRAGAPVRFEPRRAGHHRQSRSDLDAGASDRSSLRLGVRRHCPAALERLGRVRSRSRDDRQHDAASRHRIRYGSGSLEFDAYARTYAGHRTMEIDGRTIRLVPLRVGTKPTGLLAAAGRPIEPGTLDTLGGVVAIAIERAQFLEERKAGELTRQSEELKTALLASLGHDLRTPLTAIRVAATNIQASSLAG